MGICNCHHLRALVGSRNCYVARCQQYSHKDLPIFVSLLFLGTSDGWFDGTRGFGHARLERCPYFVLVAVVNWNLAFAHDKGGCELAGLELLIVIGWVTDINQLADAVVINNKQGSFYMSLPLPLTHSLS